MSVDKLLEDLGQVLGEVKATTGDKKGDDGQMVALYGRSPIIPSYQLSELISQEWVKQV